VKAHRLAPTLARWTRIAGLTALAVMAACLKPDPATSDTREVRAAGPTWSERPERAISVYPEYSHVTVPTGEPVRLDLTLENRGRRDETVTVDVAQVPVGWKASLKGGTFTVGGVPVPPDRPRVLSFAAEPGTGIRPGTYTFTLTAATPDGRFSLSQPLVVTVQDRRSGPRGDLAVTTSYPVLRGPSDSSFEFSLEVANKAEVDRVINLATEAPKGWEVTIKPGYESKQITSLRIRSAGSQTVALEVRPPRDAEAGEYPVLFRAASDRGQAEAPLKVVLTGTYRLDAATPGGRLSLDATVGKTATTTLLVRNTGTAAQRNVRLSSFAPENWKVEFAPETLEALEPGQFRQVEARITPAAQALVGDYSVGLTADGEKASKNVELRVTVHASPVWGWLGLGLAAVVIGGLGGLFAWFGRR
jgi:uncharacterized membrane protein